MYIDMVWYMEFTPQLFAIMITIKGCYLLSALSEYRIWHLLWENVL